MPANAPFKARPLGFVLASTRPIRLVDQASGEQRQLLSGDVALVPGGMVQQRSSLADEPISYFTIELVAVSDPAPPEDAERATAFGSKTPSPHRPDYATSICSAKRSARDSKTFLIPDLGTTSMVFITHGVAEIDRPGEEPEVLLPGEAASLSSEFQISRHAGW